MKGNVRSLKKRLYKLSLLPNKISRAKYYHGHNVHSPFVYGLVRNAFMSRRFPVDAEHAIASELILRGVPRRRAMQLQNVMQYCEYSTFSIDVADGSDMVVLSAEFPTERLAAACDECRRSGTTAVIMQPYANRERQDACAAITLAHHSTAVDNRAYIIVFNNRLPKQYFRL